MSGANNNAYAESKRMILGVGDIYLDGVFVGNLKGKVEFHVKREFAYQRAGNNIADQKAEVTSEEATVTAEICDLKISQLRRAFGVNAAQDIATAKTIMKRQVITVGASGANVALAETPVIDATHPFKVMSLDRKTTYVTSTDYRVSGTAFIFTSGGTLVVGSSVLVEYGFSDSGANSIRVGGETSAPPTFRMDYVIRDDTGKAWQLTFFKALADTDFKMAFSDRESGDFTTHNIGFRALVDITKAEGANLFEIVQEDATA
jgi:hypothetical protein